MALACIRADTNQVLPNEANDIVQSIDIVVNSAVIPFLHIRSKLREANEAAFGANQLDEVIALIARMLFEPARQNVRKAGRLPCRGEVDCVLAGLGTDVAQVNNHAQLRHLGDNFSTESSESGVIKLGISSARIVPNVDSALHMTRQDLLNGLISGSTYCVL